MSWPPKRRRLGAIAAEGVEYAIPLCLGTCSRALRHPSDPQTRALGVRRARDGRLVISEIHDRGFQ
jgi:hypothetical protein